MTPLFPDDPGPPSDDPPGEPEAPEAGDALHVDLGAYEGPLHVLLALAKAKKVDVTALSVASLAEQFLASLDHARDMRLEVAGDHLVMAAWLTYLKSRVLAAAADAPDEEPDLGDAETLARALAFRLKRLAAMREGVDRLHDRALDGRDVFARGRPEGVRVVTTPQWTDETSDLARAYAALRARSVKRRYEVAQRQGVTVEEARSALRRAVQDVEDWRDFDETIAHALPDAPERDARASGLAGGLDLAKAKRAELRQDTPFGPLDVRGAQP